jgi:hypothetical protein
MIGYDAAMEEGVSWLILTKLLDKPLIEQYISSIYFYITIMTTVGYGDIRATTSSERFYCMFSMLMCCGVFAYVIGSVGMVLSQRYDAETIFKQKIMFVNQYLISKNIHKNVRIKVRRYLEHVLENKKELKTDEEEVLGMLNNNLREELQFYLNTQLLKNFIIINKYEEFGCLLTKIMKEETLNPGENIFLKGDYSLKIYFINSGTVSIRDNDIVFRHIGKNLYFGEIGFFGGIKRSTSAESMSFLNVSYINLDLFKEIAYKYREIKREEYNIIEGDLNSIRSKIRNRDYSALNLSCYLCDDKNHISINCFKIKNYDEFVKLNFCRNKISLKDKRKIFEQINSLHTGYKIVTKRNSRRVSRNISKISLPSFNKNTHDNFFSFRTEDEEGENNSLSIEGLKEKGITLNQAVIVGNEKYNENDILKINKF